MNSSTKEAEDMPIEEQEELIDNIRETWECTNKLRWVNRNHVVDYRLISVDKILQQAYSNSVGDIKWADVEYGDE